MPSTDEPTRPRNIAFLLFDGLTVLDFVGVYDPLTRLRTMGFWPDLTWSVCGRIGQVADPSGLRIGVDRVGDDLSGFDLVVVPGGHRARDLVKDEGYVRWLRTAARAPWKASVCTGALLLGAAGFLKGKRATTHPTAYELLAPYCQSVVEDERVVDEGDVITARGVTAAIDLGLHLCARFAGAEVAQMIRTQMDYRTET